jgi:hypothetical protein
MKSAWVRIASGEPGFGRGPWKKPSTLEAMRTQALEEDLKFEI